MKRMVCTLLVGLSLIAAGAIETQMEEHRKIERTGGMRTSIHGGAPGASLP